jgi:Cu/Zn superoxide dismutase
VHGRTRRGAPTCLFFPMWPVPEGGRRISSRFTTQCRGRLMWQCDSPTFASAGSHFNPGGKQHGTQNPLGPHAGDMNNFMVASDGIAKTTVVNPRITLSAGSNSIFAGGGTALVVHAKADDMKSDRPMSSSW